MANQEMERILQGFYTLTLTLILEAANQAKDLLLMRVSRDSVQYKHRRDLTDLNQSSCRPFPWSCRIARGLKKSS